MSAPQQSSYLFGGAHASATLGAVAIMVKSERRGDRIISAFTGRDAPAGSCRGSMAEGFPRTRANPCDAKIKPGPGVAGCGGRSVVAYKIGFLHEKTKI